MKNKEEEGSYSFDHGGDLVARVLEKQGIQYVFTLCGGHISPLLLGASNLGINVIDVRDEKNAVFAADAVARLTGNPGVAVVTAGPGVTNTITAIKNAQMANTPLVIIGGAPATLLRGRGSLQDIEQIDLVRSIIKWSTTIKSVSEIIPKLSKAFRECLSNETGPVFVEIPLDLLYPEQMVRSWYPSSEGKDLGLLDKIRYWYIGRHVNNLFKGKSSEHIRRQELQSIHPTENDIDSVLAMFENIERPVMLIGSQVIKHVDDLEEVIASIEHLNIPSFLSGMARGLLGRKHRLKLRHKRTKALKEADMILLIGVPMDFRLDYGRKINPKATIVMVNRENDKMKLNNDFRSPAIKIRADSSLFLNKLASRWAIKNDWNPWIAKLAKRNDDRADEIEEYAKQETEYINPIKLCIELNRLIPEDSIFINDGGDFISTISYIVKPRGPLRWLDPGPFGTLGVGGGFALGAKLTKPGSQVWLFYGDGSAAYSLSEFDTCVRHNIPIIAVIGNDAGWTQIRRGQEEFFDDPLATVLDYTNYEQVVEGYGAKGLLLEREDKIEETIKKAIKLHDDGHPVLINVKIGRTDFRKGSLSM